MEYKNIVKAKFISRPNRFVGQVEIDGKLTDCHIKNTGRCRELLILGTTVYLEDFYGRMGSRKMRYSLISVQKGNTLVNIDSQAPNYVIGESLQNGTLLLPGMDKLTFIKPETVYGNSRFDFYIEDASGKSAFIEVKGVTLEINGTAKFPDAPTQRGIKHIEELCRASSENHNAYMIFLIQMQGTTCFSPNDDTHADFGAALRKAVKHGVHVLCFDCLVTPDSISLHNDINYTL